MFRGWQVREMFHILTKGAVETEKIYYVTILSIFYAKLFRYTEDTAGIGLNIVAQFGQTFEVDNFENFDYRMTSLAAEDKSEVTEVLEVENSTDKER